MSTELSLIKSEAIKFSTDELFTFASGIQSPIYCDNRSIISQVEYRDTIVNAFIKEVSSYDFDAICATATAGIPWGSFIADRIKKPLIYVRGKAKEHGLGKQIEGNTDKIEKVLVIEDLISTGKSSLEVCKVLKENHITPLAVLAIFEYGLNRTQKEFEKHFLNYKTLTNLNTVLQKAKDENLLSQNDTDIILEWKNSIDT